MKRSSKGDLAVTGRDPELDRRIDQAVDRLTIATATGTPCHPVRDLIGAADAIAAYAVQERLTTARVRLGGVVVGRKIGLTSHSVQRQLGVDQPDFGFLFEDMEVTSGGTVEMGRLIQPKIEAEIAFLLGRDLSEGPLDDQQIRDAVDWVLPSLEIVDSRIVSWDISFADTVADNASGGLYVLGGRRRRLAEFEPGACRMVMTTDDVITSEGVGADCLGDPLVALRWLAITARDLGSPLRAGQVVLSGALGPMVPIRSGSTFRAEFSGLGDVSVSFGPSDAPRTSQEGTQP
jgi:2-keto-4-pentenoate hydratase